MGSQSECFEGPVLECRDLCISYFTRAGEIPVVKGFNMTLERGGRVGLVGESGCGKSTVAMAILRYLGGNGVIVGGQVLYKGRDMAAMRPEELRRLRGSEIAMVYQEPGAALNPTMTLGRQLMEVPLCHEDVGRAEAYRQARQILADLNLADPDRVMALYPHQISGGQQQRVVIAMALLSNPALLLLDEPTTALDATVAAEILDLVGRISERTDTAIIYISHNLGLVRETCDRVKVMYSGEVVESGRIAAVFDRMRHPYTRGLLGCMPLPGVNRSKRSLTPIRGRMPLPQRRPPGCSFGPRCDFFQGGVCDREDLAMSPVPEEPGHEVRCRRWREIGRQISKPAGDGKGEPEPGEVVLAVGNLKKYYDLVGSSMSALSTGNRRRHVKANESISFEARAGETVAIVGESGSGKSTLAKVLIGLETATAGQVVLHGSDVAQVAVEGRRPEQIGALQMIFQHPSETLNPSHSVGAQLSRAIRKFGVETDRKGVQRRVTELLELVRLPGEVALRRPRQLSGGEKQRVGIARAFAGNPTTVVADEPVSALDVSVQAAIADLLTSIQKRHRTSLIFISHDVSLVGYLADRVVVMYLGHIVEQGTTAQVLQPPYHPYTEALLSAVPLPDPSAVKSRIILQGSPPAAGDPPGGCVFHTRCPRKIGAVCENQAPPVVEPVPGHEIACHLSLDELRAMKPVIVADEGVPPPGAG